MSNARTALFSIPLTLVMAACGSRASVPEEAIPFAAGETVYARVGMHFDAKGGKYLGASTNYVQVPKFVPAGTAFTFDSASLRRRSTILAMTGEDGATYEIEFVPKHSLMPLGEWIDRQFSTAPVELPADLTELERDAIATGKIVNGMSRAAVFLAVGYPPQSINPSLEDTTLNYQRNRFARRAVVFDANDQVAAGGDN
jgi:hypothetical protein